MPNIRIKDIPTTASATSSTDFIGIDGSANGTRKLNAFSPTFGGNLTVSGTAFTIGGNAAVNPLVTINSAANAGGGLLFQAAGVPKALIGLSSYILGGSSTDTIIYSNGDGILFYPSGASAGSITSSAATFGTGGNTVTLAAGAVTGLSASNVEWGIQKAAGTNYGTLAFKNVATNATWAIGIRTDAASGGTDRFSVYSSSLGGDALKLDLLTGNATFAGNLTVSGTGTSSIGGEPSTGLATYSGNLRIQSTGNGPATVNGIELQNSQSGSGYGYKIYTNNSNDYIGIAGRFSSATWTEFLAIKQNTGNVLIGTTTDGGQKLQVSGTAAFTGNVSIGNSSTAGANRLVLDGSGGAGNVSVIQFKNGGVAKGYVGLAGGFLGTASTDMLLSTDAAGASIQFYPGDAALVALTIDSSRNSTFAGKVTVNGTDGLLVNKSASLSVITMGEGIAGSYSRFNMRTGSAKYAWSIAAQDLVDNALTITPSTAVGGTTFTTPVLTVAQSGAVTVSGAIAIGNTVQTAAAVASTHKVTISIGGSTYYLLATNV